MRVTIEDRVYSLVIEPESMFDNAKGCMIQMTDIISSRGYAGEFGGAERRASKSGSRWGGNREWREEEG